MPEAPTAPPPESPPATPSAAPPPSDNGTPMDRMRTRMAAQSVDADPADPFPERTIKERPKGQAPAPPPDDDNFDDGDQPEPAPEPKEPPSKPEPAEAPRDKKVSPWKLVDQFKNRLASVEKELLETRGRVPDQATAEAAAKRLEEAEKRAASLEDQMRFIDYSRSAEFADKFQRPYEAAWAKSNTELQELEVASEDGGSRRATVQDLLALANMPLGQARQMANQMFGEAADDVMAHRRNIRELCDNMNHALEEAHKHGADWAARYQAHTQSIHNEITNHWKQFTSEDSKNHDFLKPKAEDSEWNSRLDKATSLVNQAFSENPHDPRLNAEQRAQIVRRQAAVRSRAIGFSALKLENKRLRAQLAAKNTELAQFSGSAPTSGNGKGKTSSGTPSADPMERAKARLRETSIQMPANYF